MRARESEGEIKWGVGVQAISIGFDVEPGVMLLYPTCTLFMSRGGGGQAWSLYPPPPQSFEK